MREGGATLSRVDTIDSVVRVGGVLTAIEWTLLAPVVSADVWLRFALPGGLALLLPVLVLALAAALVLAVLMAARRTAERARMVAHAEDCRLRTARRFDGSAWTPGRRPTGGRGPRAPGVLLAGS